MDEQETDVSRLIEEVLYKNGYVLGSRHEGAKRIITAEKTETRTVTVVTVNRFQEDAEKK